MSYDLSHPQKPSSEGDSPGTSNSGRGAPTRRSSRRRRGKRGHRFRPYPDGEEMKDQGKPGRMRRRQRTNSVGTPMAPYNTTSFLIQDREVRDEEEEKEEQRARMRSVSVGEASIGSLVCNGELADEYCSSSEDSSRCDDPHLKAMDEEFEGSYEQLTYEKFIEMDHRELARNMVALERTNSVVHGKLQMASAENERLKRLIREHNLQVPPSSSHNEGNNRQAPNGEEQPKAMSTPPLRSSPRLTRQAPGNC